MNTGDRIMGKTTALLYSLSGRWANKKYPSTSYWRRKWRFRTNAAVVTNVRRERRSKRRLQRRS
jgi:hypothetical protein